MKPTGHKKKLIRSICEKCGEHRAVERFKGKDLCRACLCADEEPICVPTLRCGLGELGNPGAHGFNVSAFSKEITRAMDRRGMKYIRWSQKKEYYVSK